MGYLVVDIETVPGPRYVDPAQYEWHGGPLKVADSWSVDIPDVFSEADDAPQVRSWRYAERDHLDKAAQAGEVVLAATGTVPSLHPTTCHVVQMSFGWRNGVREPINQKIVQSDDYFGQFENHGTSAVMAGLCETALLLDAFHVLSGAVGKRSVVVSFNGKQFDLPMLRARAALLCLDIPRLPWRRLLYPYSEEQHCDLRLVLGNDDRRARGTLQWWAEAFGIHAEEHGGDVWGWVRNGEWGKLRQYGETEATTLVELFDRVKDVL